MKLSRKQVWWMGFASFTCMILAIWLHRNLSEGFIREPDANYDYIIVGAGTSGSVVAAQLAETKRKVLVLEAGSSPPWYSWIPLIAPIMQGSKSCDWLFRTLPQKFAGGALRNNQFNFPQGKMVGGSGQMNFLIHATGSPADYDAWDVPGWDANSMKSVMDRLTCWGKEKKSTRSIPSLLLSEEAETCSSQPAGTEAGNSSDCHSAARTQCSTAAIKIEKADAAESPLLKAFLDAGTLLGHRIGDMNNWDYGSAFMASHNTITQGFRWNTYLSHLSPAMARYKKLHVLRNANANKILWDNDRAVGIEFTDENGRLRRVGVKNEVILSAGAIKTAQILQLSGVGPSHVLEPLDIPVRNDLPVGENFQDHLQVPLFVELRKSVSTNVAKLLQPGQIWSYLFKGRGALATSGIEGIATLGNLPCSENSKQPQGMLILFNMGSINADVYMSIANIKEEAFYRWFPKSNNMSQEGFVLISVCLHPRSRGHVRIRSIDPSKSPEIDPSYLSEPYDVECLIETIKQGASLIDTEPFRSLGAQLHWPSFPECGEDPKAENRSYMECLVRMASLTMYHPSGTSPMGKTDDPRAVLDSRLRVRGLGNVRVVDASALPSLPSGPTNSVLIAVAEKASEMILEDN